MRRREQACLMLLLVAATGPAAAPGGARPAPPSGRRAAPTGATTSALTGTWRGFALLEGSRLDFSVRFHRDGAVPGASMSCPDLLLLDRPLEGVVETGRNVRFVVPDGSPVRFHGVVDGDSIRGTAIVPEIPGVPAQGRPVPTVRFALGRGRADDEPPYAARDVRLTSGAARLAGTLYVPRSGAGRRAGVVLLSGSSSNLRRDVLFYADLFARSGLAVLAFDKRGHGGSNGDYGAATYDTLAGDAASAVDFLCRQSGVDAERVGVWGLSQGALLAPLVAARVPRLRFIVAVSAPGLPLGESAAYRDSVRLAAAGFDAADLRRVVSLQRRLSDWLATGRERAELAALLAEAADTPWRRASSLPARLPSGAALEGWYWRGRTLDPAPWWSAVRVPVLLIHGAADDLILARPNARAIERALRRGGNRDVTARMFASADHVIRTRTPAAGSRWDWPRAAPGYLELVTSWVLEHTR